MNVVIGFGYLNRPRCHLRTTLYRCPRDKDLGFRLTIKLK